MSLRLDAVLKAVLPTDTLADIGCDHGKVGIAALKAGIAKRVIFSDISAPSLKKAEALAADEGINPASVQFVCCDGCEGINFADTLVIAGMGGLEISKILDRCTFMPKQIILQPMRNIPELRDYLKNRFYTELDETVFDKKFYTVVRCTGGRENPDELQIAFGKTNLKQKSEDFKRFVANEIKKADKLSKNENCAEKWRRYRRLLEAVEGDI